MTKPIATIVSALVVAVGAAAPAALADGAPVNTVTRTVQKHFAPRKTSVSDVSCTRPSNVLAKCSAKAKVLVKSGRFELYRVRVTVHIPIDGGATALVTGQTRLK